MIGRLISAKHKFNPFSKVMTMGTGFPDFVVMKRFLSTNNDIVYKVIGIEVKSNGYLDSEERDKVKWLLDNNIFNNIIIAKKDKSGHIVYVDSQTKEEHLVGELFI